jgi:predicted restriction endonuclease
MPHNGPDVKSNIIVVCPNHHVMLDYGAINLNKELLRLNNHVISNEYIEYHNSEIYHGPTNGCS